MCAKATTIACVLQQWIFTGNHTGGGSANRHRLRSGSSGSDGLTTQIRHHRSSAEVEWEQTFPASFYALTLCQNKPIFDREPAARRGTILPQCGSLYMQVPIEFPR
jgi:hypothetical protein